MISFKCPNCGGEMNVTRSGDLYCSYCGSKTTFSDKELVEYREFRSRMLEYLSATANTDTASDEADRIWSRAERESFALESGAPVDVDYICKSKADGVAVLTARRNVILVFPAGDDRAEGYFSCVDTLSFPSADVRELRRFFPTGAGAYRLKDGGTLIALKKPETVFPLSAFGSLPAEHAAWIISRIENLCCVLAYSDTAHGGISPDSVFIDAGRHAAYLLGGWQNARRVPGGSVGDLIDLRKTAERVLGVNYNSSPKALRDFLSDPPAENAYDDFARWDAVIKEAFGGRKFVKLDLCSIKL